MTFVRGVLAVLVWCALAPAQANPTPERVADVLQEIGAQTVLPGETAPGGEGVAGDRRSAADRRAGSSWRPGIPVPGGTGLALILLWIAVGVGVVLLVIAIVGGIRARRPDAAPRRPVLAGPGAPAAAAEPALPDPAGLAAAGDHAAAVHALLLHAIATVVHRLGRLPRAETAREILARVRAASLAQQPFARLVEAAERAHFGGFAIGVDDYEHTLQHYREWTAACDQPR